MWRSNDRSGSENLIAEVKCGDLMIDLIHLVVRII